MFDSPQCLRSASTPLFSLDWWIWNWLGLAVSVGLALFLIAGVRYLRRRWSFRLNHRWAFYKLVASVVITIALLSVADRPLTAFLPPDPGTAVDAIVMLGRGGELRASRVALSVDFWKNQRAPLIFVSGIYDAPKILEMLADRGIPATARDGENCSLSTAQNALYTATILKARGVEKIILITDGPHLWRSLLDFQSQQFQQIIPIASTLSGEMRWSDQRILIVREYFCLITTGVYQLFSGQRFSPDNNPNSPRLVKLAQAYGRSKVLSTPAL